MEFRFTDEAKVRAEFAREPAKGSRSRRGRPRGQMVAGTEFQICHSPRRAAGCSSVVANSHHLVRLGWKPELNDLLTMIEHPYRLGGRGASTASNLVDAMSHDAPDLTHTCLACRKSAA